MDMDDTWEPTRDKVVRLHTLGHSQGEIAKQLGITQPAVSHHVRAARRDWQKRRESKSADDHLNEQEQLYNELLSALTRGVELGDWKAVDAAGRIAQLKAKLLGLDHSDRMNERRVRLEEAQQQIIVAALTKVFDYLELDTNKRTEALTVLRQELTAEREVEKK